jgi:hypothetical protein
MGLDLLHALAWNPTIGFGRSMPFGSNPHSEGAGDISERRDAPMSPGELSLLSRDTGGNSRSSPSEGCGPGNEVVRKSEIFVITRDPSLG